MKLKRKFLSEKNRWVISVWNKGKNDKNDATKDGSGPAWTVYKNGNEIIVPPIPNRLGVEIGVVDCGKGLARLTTCPITRQVKAMPVG